MKIVNDHHHLMEGDSKNISRDTSTPFGIKVLIMVKYKCIKIHNSKSVRVPNKKRRMKTKLLCKLGQWFFLIVTYL